MMKNHESESKPVIGVSSDLMSRNGRDTAFLTMTYLDAVSKAGGIPVVLPPVLDSVDWAITQLDGIILSGGDDPVMEPFGVVTHPQSIKVFTARQEFESQLIQKVILHTDIPVLGICLGMQMMALCHGGELNQHLPETHDSHADHWEHAHEVVPVSPQIIQQGTVWSKHRQAVQDPGSLEVIAHAPDGVIEAIADSSRPFYLGVQWHPERTPEYAMGQAIFDQMMTAAHLYKDQRAMHA